MLRAASQPLVKLYDVAMLDLDGVVYIGQDAVTDAPALLERARSAGLRLAFITNNASRPPSSVVQHLTEIGVPVEEHDVVTSAQAAAGMLAQMLPEGAPVFLLGGAGLEEALVERGLRPVTTLEEEPQAVATGYGPEVVWRRVMQGAVQIRDGLPWVASNADYTIPTSYGLGPGHGVMVSMLREFTGVEPRIAGKPERPLLDETVARMDAERPLMVGDRLDTDIEGAHNAEVDSLLVLTGVTGLTELLAAPPEQRPSYLSADLGGLLQAHPEPVADADTWTSGGWRASSRDGRLHIEGAGAVDDWWRAAAAAGWSHLDRTGEPLGTEGAEPPVVDRHDAGADAGRQQRAG